MFGKLQKFIACLLVILVTYSCNNKDSDPNSPKDSTRRSGTDTAEDGQPSVTYLYAIYEINTTILHDSIFSNPHFRRLVFHPAFIDDGQSIQFELWAEIEMTGGQRPPDTTGLLTKTGTIDLGRLTVRNDKRNYHIKTAPPQDFEHLKIISKYSSSFKLNPINGSNRSNSPGGNNPFVNHLCYNIQPVFDQSPIQDSTALYDAFGGKLNMDKEEFFKLVPSLLQLNPRPPGS